MFRRGRASKLTPDVVQLVEVHTTSIPPIELRGIQTVQFVVGHRSPKSASGLIIEMSADLAVGIFLTVGSDGSINASHAPPMLYVLDTRTEADDTDSTTVAQGTSKSVPTRLANLTLNSSVRLLYSLAPLIWLNHFQNSFLKIYCNASGGR